MMKSIPTELNSGVIIIKSWLYVSAIKDLPSGAICDEIDERRYCAHSLVCHQCPDEKLFKCVSCKFAYNYATLYE